MPVLQRRLSNMRASLHSKSGQVSIGWALYSVWEWSSHCFWLFSGVGTSTHGITRLSLHVCLWYAPFHLLIYDWLMSTNNFSLRRSCLRLFIGSTAWEVVLLCH